MNNTTTEKLYDEVQRLYMVKAINLKEFKQCLIMLEKSDAIAVKFIETLIRISAETLKRTQQAKEGTR